MLGDQESSITRRVKEIKNLITPKGLQLKLRLVKVFLYLRQKQGQGSRMDPMRQLRQMQRFKLVSSRVQRIG
jgi:hypothetical protein